MDAAFATSGGAFFVFRELSPNIGISDRYYGRRETARRGLRFDFARRRNPARFLITLKTRERRKREQEGRLLLTSAPDLDIYRARLLIPFKSIGKSSKFHASPLLGPRPSDKTFRARASLPLHPIVSGL